MRQPHISPTSMGSSMYFGVTIVLAASLLAIIFGFASAIFSPSLLAKLAAVLLCLVVLLFSLLSTSRADSNDPGRKGRLLLNYWLVLIGACPAYLPFKFGALPGLNPLRICFATVALVLLHSMLTSAQLRRTLSENFSRFPWASRSLLAFAIWQTISAIIGDEPALSLYYLSKSFLPAIVIFCATLTYHRNWQDVQRTLTFSLIGTSISCAISIVEWKTQSNPFTPFISSDPDQMADLQWILADKSRGGSYRVSGVFSHPLALGEYLCMTLPIILLTLFRSKATSIRWFAAVLIPLSIAAIYSTHTRSTALGAASGVLVITLLVGIRSLRQNRRLGLAMFGWMSIVVTLACTAALFVGGTYLAQGRNSAESGSSQARIEMVRRGMGLLSERPIQGYGAGLAAIKIGPIGGHRELTIDSYYLSVAIESGGVGIALLGLFLSVVCLISLSNSLDKTSPYYWISIALSGGIIGSLVIKVILSLTNNLEYLFLLLGLCVVCASFAKDAMSGPNRDTSSNTPLRESESDISLKRV
jgi:O-Antigen ligase